MLVFHGRRCHDAFDGFLLVTDYEDVEWIVNERLSKGIQSIHKMGAEVCPSVGPEQLVLEPSL